MRIEQITLVIITYNNKILFLLSNSFTFIYTLIATRNKSKYNNKNKQTESAFHNQPSRDISLDRQTTDKDFSAINTPKKTTLPDV